MQGKHLVGEGEEVTSPAGQNLHQCAAQVLLETMQGNVLLFSCYCALSFQKPVLRWPKQMLHTEWSLNVSESAKPHVLKFSAGATVRKTPVLKFTSTQICSLLKPSLHTIGLNYAPFTKFLQQTPPVVLVPDCNGFNCVYGNISCWWGI